MPPRSVPFQPLPDDLPRNHVDTLVLMVALRVLEREWGTHPDQSIDSIIRDALQSTHTVGLAIDDGTGVQIHGDTEWRITASRALQFATVMRYAVSDEGAIDMDQEPTASHWLGMADAWALRQGLFREDDSLS